MNLETCLWAVAEYSTARDPSTGKALIVIHGTFATYAEAFSVLLEKISRKEIQAKSGAVIPVSQDV